ncbi:FIMAH domain-containing protein [Virgibacillus kekensis]|uniref:FIMAH domain-containing protein n=1 Tax=Virgibacillus kekensis TaxID=202261 RepID=A0ABV9DJR4_9BACI
MRGKPIINNWMYILAGLLLLILAGFPSLAQANSGQESTELSNTTYGEPEKLLAPLTGTVSIFDGVVGKEDGHNVMYTTAKGIPARLNVVDLDNYKLLRTITLEGAESTWAHEVTVDGDLYIATIGGGAKLWKYSPKTKVAEVVATFPGQTFPYSITSDPEGNVYVGTYPSGKVYKFNSEREEVTDYGKMIDESSRQYIRSIAYIDGNIYAGTAKDKIIKYNIASGEKSNIAASLDETGTVYDMDKVDNRYLFIRYNDTKNGYIYDTQTQKWLDVIVPNVRGLHVEEESYNGSVYYMTPDDKFMSIDLNTLEINDTGMRYGSGLRGADWVEFNDPQLPGKSLVTINWSGSVTIFNIETNQVIERPSLVKGAPAIMNQVKNGPDGNIYISGTQATEGAIFSPSDNSTVSFNLGQGDSMSSFGDKMLFGVYPGARIFEYDTKRDPANNNPKQLFQIGEDQDRIGDIISADGKTFIGSIPDYGKLGGALTIYDPTGEQTTPTVYRNIVENQSVVSLAYKEGIVYGSTSVNGGLGIDPVAKEAKIFKWDVENEQKIEEISLSIEGVNNPQTIGDLSFGENGLLWGAVDNIIFALDPHTLNVVKSKKIYPDGALYYADWQTVVLEWSNDILYAKFDNNLTAIDPKTLVSHKITEAKSFTIGDDGNIYYSLPSNRTLLYKVEVSSTGLIQEILDSYHTSEDIKQPVYAELTNKLEQAKHQLNKDDKSKAVKHLNALLKHLNNESLSEFISNEAKGLLNAKVENLITALSSGEDEPPANSIPLLNSDFEEPLADGIIPGWTHAFQESEEHYHEISDERSFSGNSSLKIVDTVRSASVALYSDKIDVEPGVEYMAATRAYTEEGSASFLLRFYDKDGNQVANYANHFESMLGQWEEVNTQGVAPENAAYVRIYAYTTSYQVGTVYFDDINLWTKQN